MAKDRQTRIPEDNGVEVPEDWELDGPDFRIPAEEQDSLLQAVFDAVTIVRHIGGVVQIAPVRKKLADGIYLTTEFAFAWNSYVPPVQDDVEAEPEPVAQAA